MAGLLFVLNWKMLEFLARRGDFLGNSIEIPRKNSDYPVVIILKILYNKQVIGI